MRITKWRGILIGLITLLALYGVVPSLVYFYQPKEIRNDQEALSKKIPSFFPGGHIKLGLDLQGGVQLVLGVSTVEAVQNKLGRDSVEIARWAVDKGFKVKPAYVIKEQQVIKVEMEEGQEVEPFREALKKEFQSLSVADRGDNFINFTYDEQQINDIKAGAIEQAERVIRSRVDKWGVSEPIINRRAGNTILVQLPGFRDPQKAKELLGRTAQLQFKLVDEEFTGFADIASGKLPEGVTYERSQTQIHFLGDNREVLTQLLKDKVPQNRELLFGKEFVGGNKNIVKYKSYVVQAATAMTGEDILDAYMQRGGGIDQYPEVGLKFTGPGSRRMAEVSGENIGKRLAIILDNEVYSDPVLKVKITQGAASITLGGGKGYNEIVEEATQLSLVLKSGALPATITVLEERQVGASLGPELANQGIRGTLVGLFLVLVYMVIYYRRPGLIACMALVLNALYVIALMAGLNFALTLPGIAGFILTLGMAVDANVLINERIRQELTAGKNAKKAIELGFDKVLWTVLDSNITSLIAALVLLETNSSGPVRGFAITLMVGLVVSLFTSLYCTRVFFEFFLNRSLTDEQIRRWLGGASMGSTTKGYNFNFLGGGKAFAIVAVVVGLLSLGNSFYKGLNWGVDFAGGTEMLIGFSKNIEPDLIRGVASEAGLKEMTMQALEGESKLFLMRFDEGEKANSKVQQEVEAAQNSEKVQQLQSLILTKLKDYGAEIHQVDYVGPQIGHELRNQGLISVFYAILGVILYMAIRFDIAFVPGAMVKMVLDAIILLGFYSFFRRTFDLTSVAAFLTIVGYSINDTVVVFDRIRENIREFGRRTLWDNINISLNETLTRSINTSGTTIASLIGILIFASGQIWDFALAMVIGVIVATLSTTFISSSAIIWTESIKTWWQGRNKAPLKVRAS